jgi:hypothetical protein
MHALDIYSSTTENHYTNLCQCAFIGFGAKYHADSAVIWGCSKCTQATKDRCAATLSLEFSCPGLAAEVVTKLSGLEVLSGPGAVVLGYMADDEYDCIECRTDACQIDAAGADVPTDIGMEAPTAASNVGAVDMSFSSAAWGTASPADSLVAASAFWALVGMFSLS